MVKPAPSAEDININLCFVLRPHPAPKVSSLGAVNVSEPKNSTRSLVAFFGCSRHDSFRFPAHTTHCAARVHGKLSKSSPQTNSSEITRSAHAADQRRHSIGRRGSSLHRHLTIPDRLTSHPTPGKVRVRTAHPHHGPCTSHGRTCTLAYNLYRYSQGIREEIIRPPRVSSSLPSRPRIRESILH